MEREYVVELSIVIPVQPWCAVQASFIGATVECFISDPAIWIRSQLGKCVYL